LHQVGDLFELNVKFRCQKFKQINFDSIKMHGTYVKKKLYNVNT